MQKINVLVVDDKKVIRDFFDITLGYYGHQITVVHDPALVAQTAQETKFDIAFVDMIMPDADGVVVLQKLKDVCPDLPVVMMSGYSGACGCLKKPFEMEDIRRIVKEATGKDI